MVYEPSYILFNLIANILLRIFIYTHQSYWLVIFLSFFIFYFLVVPLSDFGIRPPRMNLGTFHAFLFWGIVWEELVLALYMFGTVLQKLEFWW